MIRVILALLVAFALLPLASAQEPLALRLDEFAGAAPVQEGVPPARAALQIEYDCNRISAENWTEASVELAVRQAPDWLRAEVSPARFALGVDPADCAWGETRLLRANVTARAAPEAPALQPAVVEVEARFVTGNGTLWSVASGTVRAAFVGAFRLDAPAPNATARPQEVVTFPLELENLGNGMTRFTFEIVDKSAGLSVPVPNSIVLEPPAEASTRTNASLNFVALTPYHNGYVDEEDWVTLRVTAVSAEDPAQKGESRDVTFRVQTQGAYAPGPAPVLALLLVAALALLRRR